MIQFKECSDPEIKVKRGGINVVALMFARHCIDNPGKWFELTPAQCGVKRIIVSVGRALRSYGYDRERRCHFLFREIKLCRARGIQIQGMVNRLNSITGIYEIVENQSNFTIKARALNKPAQYCLEHEETKELAQSQASTIC